MQKFTLIPYLCSMQKFIDFIVRKLSTFDLRCKIFEANCNLWDKKSEISAN